MDSCLLKSIPTDLPVWRRYSGAPVLKGYSNITSITPLLTQFMEKDISGEGQLQADNLFGRTIEFSGAGTCVIQTIQRQKKDSFCKITHLLDPTRSLQAFYTHPEKGKRRQADKLNSPMNQAYIDALANYLLGQLRERNASPHFCNFYGGFQAVANTYKYEITDEFESYRKYKKFWQNMKKGLFHLVCEELEEEGIDINTPNTTVYSHSFSYSTVGSKQSSRASHITLDGEEEPIVELESLHSVDINEEEQDEKEEGEKKQEDEDDDDDDEDEDEDDEDEDDEEVSIYAEFSNYPVMLIFQEKMEGVLEELLNSEDHGTPEWEARWIAWIFQIIAALSVAQGLLGFTHNDLHTNNIVWSDTDVKYFLYKNKAGEIWKVPTFGKVFRIIDFGRAIFRVRDKWYISDDFAKGGDAEGQYNFDSMKDYKSYKPTVYPNPSFDLCRFSVSIIDALFPTMPVEKLDGAILNKEDNWEVHETDSELWNLLWSWLIDDKGMNVLREQDGSERFPDFDLYTHIAAHVYSAKPQIQISRPIFNKFKVNMGSLHEKEKVYPLFF